MRSQQRRHARGLVGVTLILIGVVILGANIRYGTRVAVDISANHGLHETDIAGAGLVFLGTALVWFRR